MRVIFILIICLFTTYCMAQTVEPSASVESETLQIELESQYSIEKDAGQKITSWSLPSALIRYGVLNKAEFQFSIPVTRQQVFNGDKLVETYHEIGDMQVGMAIDLWKQHKLIPEASLMARAIVPVAQNDVSARVGKILSLNLMNQLTERLSFNYNVGFLQDIDLSSSGFYIINFTYELNQKFHFFVEQFGDFTMDDFLSHSFNIGFGSNLVDNLSVDFSFANGLDYKMNYVGVILTWVTHT